MLLAALLILGGCAAATSGPSITTSAYGIAEQIPTTVLKPDGPGPFPKEKRAGFAAAVAL